jgi:hypothetical protein
MWCLRPIRSVIGVRGKFGEESIRAELTDRANETIALSGIALTRVYCSAKTKAKQDV